MRKHFKNKAYFTARWLLLSLALALFLRAPASAAAETVTPEQEAAPPEPAAAEAPAQVVAPVEAVPPVMPQSDAPAAEAAAPDVQADEEYLLLQLVIDEVEMEDVIEALQRGGRLYLPLGQLSSLLDFAIKVDPAARTASGWFIREQNTLKLSEQAAEVKGKKIDLRPGSVIADDREVYVDAALMSEWFPIEFTTDLKRMTLGLETREDLPFKAKMLRQQRQEKLGQQKQAKEETFKSIDAPYAAAQWPTVDLTISPSYDSRSDVHQNNYSVYAVGDLGYLTSRLFASGDLADNALSDLRLSFGRDDYRNRLLGPLEASSFRFGDINSTSLSQVAVPTQTRGFTLTNRALDRPDNFDVTNFIGDSQPGWDVELYRNGALIDFQTVGTDGRYAFRNVPILFGNNQFRLVFYGPQGQVQEISKVVNAEGSLLEKGQFSYDFSAGEKNETVFSVSDNSGQTTGVTGVGEVEYGVSRWLTVAAGGAHVPLRDGKDHSYATAGLRTSLGGVLASLDGAYDATEKGYSLRASASTSFYGTLLSGQQIVARDFVSEENGDLTNPIERQTVLRADRQFGTLNAALSYTNRVYENERKEHLWTSQLSKTVLDAITVTNTLQYNYDNLGLDQLNGSIFARGYFNRILVGAQLDYDVKPDRDPRLLKLSGQFPISEKIIDNLEFTANLQGDKRKELSNTATFDMGRYKLSAVTRVDDEMEFYGGLALNVSFGRLPDSDKWIFSSRSLAETGTIAVYPYIDRNYNQKRDPGEGPPPSSSLKVGSQTLKVDKRGAALASQLTTNLPVQIRIDPENQEANPFWSAGVDGYTVVPRPGRVIAVDFPVFETSQVDGTVTVPPGVNPKDIVVELVNTEGQAVRSTRAAFDGYYLVEGVMPGSYTLRVSQESLAEKGLRQDAQPTLAITTSDFFIKDIQLVPADATLPEGQPMAEAATLPQTVDEPQEQAAAAVETEQATAPAAPPATTASAEETPPVAPSAAPTPAAPTPAKPAAAQAASLPARPVIEWAPPAETRAVPAATPVIISLPPAEWKPSAPAPRPATARPIAEPIVSQPPVLTSQPRVVNDAALPGRSLIIVNEPW